MMPRHGPNGAYPRGGQNTFDISPHKYGPESRPTTVATAGLPDTNTSRFQPRASGPANRRRKKLFTKIGVAALTLIAISLWLWPTSPVAAIFSFGFLSYGSGNELETVRYYDLTNVQGTARGWEREERILMCVPLRDAEPHLGMLFGHLRNLTYPHHLIDLAFLVSDSKDKTLEVLSEGLEALQADEDAKQPYGEISVIEKDFGQKIDQGFESRHGFEAQATRRKLMAQARNWLLSAALRPYHSWVYWRDVDVQTAPFTILEDLMRHNKDVIVPNVWRPLPFWLGGEQPYDLNSWQESETALALAETLDEDAVIVEGYAEYATWRPHLAYLRDPFGDPDTEMDVDGVGGVSILAKAKVFRSGVHFPAFSFERHAETEGFGKMAKRMKYLVTGLPHYTIWHLYEPSADDLVKMAQNEKEFKDKAAAKEKEEAEKKAKEQEAIEKKAKDEAEAKAREADSKDGSSQLEQDKAVVDKAATEEKQEEAKPAKPAAAPLAQAPKKG